ncbi:MAG: 2-oxoglutarate and iron-dependent oxygenase domain-containing protein, partial [Robiginitalea sp.]
MKQIPSVDLREFTSGDTNKKSAFVQGIGRAFEDIGFVALSGHFLPDSLVDNLYEEVKKFF